MAWSVLINGLFILDSDGGSDSDASECYDSRWYGKPLATGASCECCMLDGLARKLSSLNID